MSLIVELGKLSREARKAIVEYLKSKPALQAVQKRSHVIVHNPQDHKNMKQLLEKFLYTTNRTHYRIANQAGILSIFPPEKKKKAPRPRLPRRYGAAYSLPVSPARSVAESRGFLWKPED